MVFYKCEGAYRYQRSGPQRWVCGVGMENKLKRMPLSLKLCEGQDTCFICGQRSHKLWHIRNCVRIHLLFARAINSGRHVIALFNEVAQFE